MSGSNVVLVDNIYFDILLRISAHLVTLALDRVWNLTHAVQNFGKNWNNFYFKVSIGLTLYHCIIISPYLLFYHAENGLCQPYPQYETLLKLHQFLLSTVFYTLSHFIIVAVSGCVFISKLTEHRTAMTGVKASANAISAQSSLVNMTEKHQCTAATTLSR